jgi:hypothetical protein
MFITLHIFLIRNTIFCVLIIHTILTYLIFDFLEEKYSDFINYSYYYWLVFCYIFGQIMFGLILEIYSCVVIVRYPRISSIKTTYNNIINSLVYPSPNRILY